MYSRGDIETPDRPDQQAINLFIFIKLSHELIKNERRRFNINTTMVAIIFRKTVLRNRRLGMQI